MSDKTYTLTCPDRRSALRAWLACFSISKKEFAEALEIHPTRVSGILASDTAPALVILKMHEFGVPDNLLPKRSRRKGRPRGHVSGEQSLPEENDCPVKKHI